MKDCVCSLIGQSLGLWLQVVWVQVPSDTPIHWYSIMVNAGVLYTQDYRFKSYYQYYLGVPEWSKGTDCKSDDSWVQIPPPSLCVI